MVVRRTHRRRRTARRPAAATSVAKAASISRFGAGVKHMTLQPERARRRLHVSIARSSAFELLGLTSTAIDAALGTSSCSSSSRFARPARGQEGDARDVAARPVEAGDKAELDRVAADREDDRDRRGRRLGRKRRRRAAGRDDHRHLTANQIGRQRRQPIILALRPAVFDRDVPALDIAGFAQALAERGQYIRPRRQATRRRGTRSPASPAAARAPRAATPPPRRRGG